MRAAPVRERGLRWRVDRWAERVFLAAALASALVTLGIVVVLVRETLAFLGTVSPWAFLGGVEWTPLFPDPSFGVLPLLWGSLLVALIALAVGGPLGLLTALFLSEFADSWARNLVQPVLNLLSGIPTVALGYFALAAVGPGLQALFPGVGAYSAAGAGIVVGFLILPMVASLSTEAMAAVPGELREAAYALGADRTRVALRLVIPAARSGILASGILAFSRALGETMVVTMAAGTLPNLTTDPLEPIQAMTAYLMQVALGDAPSGSLVFRSLFAVAFLLFLLTSGLNLLAQVILARFRRGYG